MIEENKIMKGVKFWEDQLTRAGVVERLPFFNDLVTGDTYPTNSAAEIKLKDITLDGRKVDVYHYEGTSKLYLHIK